MTGGKGDTEGSIFRHQLNSSLHKCQNLHIITSFLSSTTFDSPDCVHRELHCNGKEEVMVRLDKTAIHLRGQSKIREEAKEIAMGVQKTKAETSDCKSSARDKDFEQSNRGSKKTRHERSHCHGSSSRGGRCSGQGSC
ncbi:hypothetical protein HA466_0199400 [Hirschfeldia incana]|nr:hypothetical protein HA466_0199400 [Hirschfeldia incana]